MNEFLKVAQSVTGVSLLQQLLNKDAKGNSRIKSRLTTLDFKNSSFSIKGKDIHQLRDFRSFSNNNQDLLYAISKSDAAMKTLEKTKVSSREDLVKIVSEAAYDAVKNSANAPSNLKTKFQQDPKYAALVLSNVGGIQELLKKEEVSQDFFSTSSGEDQVFKKLAEKAAALFEKDNSLNDVSFFQNHVDAAIYVLNKPTLVSTFNNGDSGIAAALAFKTNADRADQEALFQDTAVTLARNSVNRSTYTESFFEENEELTQFVVATDLLKFSTTGADVLKSNLSLQSNNIALGDHYNYTQFVDDTIAKDAVSRLGSHTPLNSSFFKLHPQLSQLLRDNDEFRKNISSSDTKKQLQVLFGEKDASTKDLKEVMSSLQKSFNAAREISYVI